MGDLIQAMNDISKAEKWCRVCGMSIDNVGLSEGRDLCHTCRETVCREIAVIICKKFRYDILEEEDEDDEE